MEISKSRAARELDLVSVAELAEMILTENPYESLIDDYSAGIIARAILDRFIVVKVSERPPRA